jgi:hypothetical protein
VGESRGAKVDDRMGADRADEEAREGVEMDRWRPELLRDNDCPIGASDSACTRTWSVSISISKQNAATYPDRLVWTSRTLCSSFWRCDQRRRRSWSR